jgi:hypothetical protein
MTVIRLNKSIGGKARLLNVFFEIFKFVNIVGPDPTKREALRKVISCIDCPVQPLFRQAVKDRPLSK